MALSLVDTINRPLLAEFSRSRTADFGQKRRFGGESKKVAADSPIAWHPSCDSVTKAVPLPSSLFENQYTILLDADRSAC